MKSQTEPSAGGRRLATGHLHQTRGATARMATAVAQTVDLLVEARGEAEVRTALAAALSRRAAAVRNVATRQPNQSRTQGDGVGLTLIWTCQMTRCVTLAMRRQTCSAGMCLEKGSCVSCRRVSLQPETLTLRKRCIMHHITCPLIRFAVCDRTWLSRGTTPAGIASRLLGQLVDCL